MIDTLKLRPACVALLLAFSSVSMAQIPEVPTYPEDISWDTSCDPSDASCKLFDENSSFTEATKIDSQGVNTVRQAIIGQQKAIGKINDQKLIVTGIPSGSSGVDLIYASSTFYSGPALTNASTGNSNTLLIELNNKDSSPLILNGVDNVGEPTVAASAHQGGVANNNSLLIRNSDIHHGTDGRKRNFVTAAYVWSQMDPEKSDGDLATYNNNTVVIENSSLRGGAEGAANSHNINLAAVYLVGPLGSNFGDLSPFEANYNAIWIKGSELDINSAYVAYNNGSSVKMSEANHNLFWSEDAKINLSFISKSWLENDTLKKQIGNSRLVAADKFDSTSNNILHLKNTHIEIDQELLVARAVEDGYGRLTIAAATAGSNAFNNLTELVDVSFSVISSKEEFVNKKPLITIGSAGASIYNDEAEKKIAEGNVTRILGVNQTSDWTLDGSTDFRIYGGLSVFTPTDLSGASDAGTEASVLNNAVEISNVKLRNAEIYGGWVEHVHNIDEAYPEHLTGVPLANGNEVHLSKVEITESAQVAGARVTQGNVTGNTLTVSEGQYRNVVFSGGQVDQNGSAVGNLIYLDQTALAEADIFGGKVDALSVNTSDTAVNNTVVINDVRGLDGGDLKLGKLYGGYLTSAVDQKQAVNGNKLYTNSRITTSELGGFQHYNFVVSEDSFSNGAMLTVTGDKPVVMQTNGKNQSSIAVGGTDLRFEVGDTYTLIDSASGFTDLDGSILNAETDFDSLKQDMEVTKLASVIRIEKNEISREDYELGLDETGNKLNMTVVGQSDDVDTVNPETDVLMQASVASLASLFAADDLLVDTALKSRNNTRLDGPFAAMRVGTWSHDATSRFETNVYSGLLGWALHASDVEFGPFIEIGRGDYEMKDGASGRHNYVGAGIYANWQTPFYVRLTGYLKGGAMENDFETKLVGQSFDFDNTFAYWGAHIGANLDINVTEKLRARPFVSYFYDGRESESFTKHGGVVDGAKFDFDTINAHRIQVGSMFEYAYSNTSRPYFGITYEQVIKAEAEGSARDAQGKLSLNSSDVEGATGIISAGWSYLNTAGDFEFNFGVNGYGGARNGVSAQMGANWKF